MEAICSRIPEAQIWRVLLSLIEIGTREDHWDWLAHIANKRYGSPEPNTLQKRKWQRLGGFEPQTGNQTEGPRNVRKKTAEPHEHPHSIKNWNKVRGKVQPLPHAAASQQSLSTAPPTSSFSFRLEEGQKPNPPTFLQAPFPDIANGRKHPSKSELQRAALGSTEAHHRMQKYGSTVDEWRGIAINLLGRKANEACERCAAIGVEEKKVYKGCYVLVGKRGEKIQSCGQCYFEGVKDNCWLPEVVGSRAYQ